MFDTPDVYSWIAWAVAGLAFLLGLQTFGVAGLFIVIVTALLLITGGAYVIGTRARRALARRDDRFKPTDEVFRDHATGEVVRVHVDGATGERRYWKDR